MKANKIKRFFEFVAVLCLFLAVGVDWNFEGGIPMPNQTVFEHYRITSEYSSYIPPQVAEQAVNQAIEAADRREQRDQAPRAKIRVGVMGEKYIVENLQFDGFFSWKRKPVDVQALALEKAREIHRLAFEVSINELAMVDSSFSPNSFCYGCSVWPVNTSTFKQSTSVHVYPDQMAELSDLEMTTSDLASLDAMLAFLTGLLDKNEPLLTNEAAAA